jgi:UDPglucose 6-dehydrogenase
LALKPNTDDMREEPSRVFVEGLPSRGARTRAGDPVAIPEWARLREGRPSLSSVGRQSEALAGADALVVVTEWKEFRNPDFDAIKAPLKQPLIFDGRNLYALKLMAMMGIDCRAIGRAV